MMTTTWTRTARERLERYFEEVRGTLRASGADPDEVSEDIRRHIDEEIVARQLEVVTEEDVRQILARIGAPEVPAAASEPVLASGGAVGAGTGRGAGLGRRAGHWVLLIFGAVLPALTIVIEMFTHMCAGVFFDPIPTIWHVLMVAAVPAANAWAWWSLRRGGVRFPRGLGVANGFAVGVAAFYALLYLPILPFAIIGLFYVGWGLLPMAPLLGLIAALVLRRQVRLLPGAGGRLAPWWPGLGLAVLALAFTVLPATLTRHWAQQAASDAPEVRARAVQWLRWLGEERTLLADCYGATAWMRQSPIDLHLFGVPVNPEQARETYFRVTGRPFNSLPPPQLSFTRGGWNLFDEFTWDREQGGEAVGSRVKGLSLVSSRLDGMVEGDGAMAYVEWTMEFRNIAAVQHEARAQVALPPGGVVSRLTLWVNGEEREAAFAGRAQVRKAYEEVAIRRRQDPVLVTTAGPDRVLVQCFPVPPDGGLMKIRIGITAPLAMETLETGFLQWPHFLERNFSLGPALHHAVWVESRAALASGAPTLQAQPGAEGRQALRGQLADPLLDEPASVLRVRRAAEVARVWTAETAGAGTGMVRQVFALRRPEPPARVALVVDGSRSMAGVMLEVAAAIAQLPEGMEVTAFIAGDEVTPLTDGPVRVTAATRKDLADRLRRVEAAGGQDNVPALLRGLEAAGEVAGGTVLWLHGPQPVLLGRADELAQRFLWRGDQLRLLDFQIASGPNRIAEALDGVGRVEAVPRAGSLREDLARVFATWSGERQVVEIVRERVESADLTVSTEGRQVSKHLARLWAREEVLRLLERRFREAATRLAGDYQLVTPVSGAVVLETAEQFARAGLDPADASTVPSVPEPGALWWLAGGLGLAALLHRRCRRHRLFVSVSRAA